MSSIILNYLFQLTNFLTTLISIITNILLIICTILFILLVTGLIYFYVNKEKYFLLNLLLKQCDTPPISSTDSSSLSSLFDQINCFNLSNFANKNRIEENEYIDTLVPKQEFLYKEALDEFLKNNCIDSATDYQNLDVGVKIKKIV